MKRGRHRDPILMNTCERREMNDHTELLRQIGEAIIALDNHVRHLARVGHPRGPHVVLDASPETVEMLAAKFLDHLEQVPLTWGDALRALDSGTYLLTYLMVLLDRSFMGLEPVAVDRWREAL